MNTAVSVASDETINDATKSRGLDIALWIVQILLFLAFALGGVMKATAPIDELGKNLAWVFRMPPAMVRFIGVSELAGGLGVLLPAATRIAPFLTPLAAGGLVTIQILAAGHHLMNGEAYGLPINLTIGALAAFVAWGRWKKRPIAARS